MEGDMVVRSRNGNPVPKESRTMTISQRQWKIALATALFAAAYSQLGLAQVASPTILEIDVENVVIYFADTFDVTKFATNSGLTTTPAPQNFEQDVSFADIVAVNGQPARGTLSITGYTVGLRTAPLPGQAIADTIRTAYNQYSFEILSNEGVPIGSLFLTGLAGGGAPPGAPLQVTATSAAIVGGTGPFLGARGQMGAGGNTSRQTSITEDPVNRRINGGGKGHYVLHIIPMERPEIVTTTTGLAVFHADFSPVTSAKPAKAGEVLIVRATGLGPTVPGVNSGQPFPSDALQAKSTSAYPPRRDSGPAEQGPSGARFAHWRSGRASPPA